MREHSFHPEKYDLNYTLLHLGSRDHGPALAEPYIEDAYDRFMGGVGRRP